MMKKINLIFFALIFTSCFNSYGQKGYVNGYIVTHENDTINGMIKLKGHIASSKSITFISDNGVKQKYTPKDIKLFSKKVWVYRSLPLPGNLSGVHVFMKEIQTGQVNLYKIMAKQYSSSLAFTGTGAPTTVQYKAPDVDVYYVAKKNSMSLTLVSEHDFKKMMSKYFIELSNLSKAISDGEYLYEDIQEIVKLYNKYN